MTLFLYLAGIFTLTLGIIHLFLPSFLHYRNLILGADQALHQPFVLPIVNYPTSQQDLYGIIWVMNHAASMTLISIGLVDLLGHKWLQASDGRWLALWIAGWWGVRAVSQLYMGKRWGDWLIMAWFTCLGLIHLAVFL